MDDVLPKIHTFQKSLEAVLQRLVEAERAQTALSNTSMARMNNGGTATESEILLFRNQLKVLKLYNTLGLLKISKKIKDLVPFRSR